jgi:hypothetical protein
MYFKKLSLVTVICSLVATTMRSEVVSLDTIISSNDPTTVCAALESFIQSKSDVVVYMGTADCEVCKNIKHAVYALLSQYPAITFVIADLAKYPFLKNHMMYPKARFMRNCIRLHEEGSLTVVRFKELLARYYT